MIGSGSPIIHPTNAYLTFPDRGWLMNGIAFFPGASGRTDKSKFALHRTRCCMCRANVAKSWSVRITGVFWITEQASSLPACSKRAGRPSYSLMAEKQPT